MKPFSNNTQLDAKEIVILRNTALNKKGLNEVASISSTESSRLKWKTIFGKLTRWIAPELFLGNLPVPCPFLAHFIPLSCQYLLAPLHRTCYGAASPPTVEYNFWAFCIASISPIVPRPDTSPLSAYSLLFLFRFNTFCYQNSTHNPVLYLSFNSIVAIPINK